MRVATIISFKIPTPLFIPIFNFHYGDIKKHKNLITNTIIVSNAREWVTRTFFVLKIGQT